MGHPGHRENVPPGKMGVIAFVTFTMEKLVIWTLLLRYRWWIKMEMLMMMMTTRRRTTSENYQGYLKSICWASECGNFSHQQVLPHVYTRRWGLLIAKQQKRCAWFTYIAQFSPGKIICLKSLNIKRLLWMGCIFFGEGGGLLNQWWRGSTRPFSRGNFTGQATPLISILRSWFSALGWAERCWGQI